DRLHAELAGADPHHLGHGQHEDQAVAGLARVGGGDDRLDGALGDVRRHHALDLELRQQADVRGRAPVVLGVALLAPAALDLGHVEAADPDLVERVLHLLQALVADDRLDLADARFAHFLRSRCSTATAALTAMPPRPRARSAPAAAGAVRPAGPAGGTRSPAPACTAPG